MAGKDIRADRGGLAYDGSGVGNKPTFNINQTARYRSLLNPLLEKIIDNYDQKPKKSDDNELPDPMEKIEFNDVKVFGEEINECISFLSVVEEQVDAIDDEEPGSKDKFLKAIHQNYKNHRRELLIINKADPSKKEDVISLVRSNADNLILSVSNTVIGFAEVDLHHCPVEDVQGATSLIVCYGFVNCKILERPDDYK
ncbi:hypothetical protein [Vreelandella lutescens]|uniref:Uncharacterized protein n=1 Tax=Vreelandella lutescens TaxID=1602943 RepID=A0ABQ1NQK3_9GAMM|nr:hypothetical protein [Halomonas lutescens]GGC82723.1 hypothetical protein GCM10011382_11080 [Halomonas lutescens]